jgi:hypothetical protein
MQENFLIALELTDSQGVVCFTELVNQLQGYFDYILFLALP